MGRFWTLTISYRPVIQSSGWARRSSSHLQPTTHFKCSLEALIPKQSLRLHNNIVLNPEIHNFLQELCSLSLARDYGQTFRKESCLFFCVLRDRQFYANQPYDDRSSWRDSLELKVWNINQPLSLNLLVVDFVRERERGLVSKESVLPRTESVCEWNWIYHMKGFK